MEQPTLDEALRSLNRPEELPSDLPLSHLIDARDLGRILAAGQFGTWPCKFFQEELLYVFYGGVVYRRSTVPTNNASILPIVFLFRPDILERLERLYPFDTGAAHKKLYGSPWDDLLAPFQERFRVKARNDPEAAARMVYYIFRTNEDYIYNPPHSSCRTLPEPLPVLHDFLSADLTDRRVDQRYRTMEGHAKDPLSWEDLIWIGYPDSEEENVRILAQQLPHPPVCFPYKAFPASRPSEAAAHLQYAAQEAIIRHYMDRRR